MNDIAKYLAINFSNKRDQDQYIIDHADYFTCEYKTKKRNISATFKSLTDARTAANFSSEIQYKQGKSNPKRPIKIKAWIGENINALVEEIVV